MEIEMFGERLLKLRMEKGVSAREMSLAIGQNAGYINSIEGGKSMPSMASFLYICQYLNIEPVEFFDMRSENPAKLRKLVEKMKKLDTKQLNIISSLVDNMTEE